MLQREARIKCLFKRVVGLLCNLDQNVCKLISHVFSNWISLSILRVANSHGIQTTQNYSNFDNAISSEKCNSFVDTACCSTMKHIPFFLKSVFISINLSTRVEEYHLLRSFTSDHHGHNSL